MVYSLCRVEWNCTHFWHHADEQLRLTDISGKNNLLVLPLVVVCFVSLFLPWSKHSPKCFSILNCHPSSMTSQPLISIVISYRQRKPNNINGNRKKIFRFIVAFITLVLDISEKGWHSPICLFFFVFFFFFSKIYVQYKQTKN